MRAKNPSYTKSPLSYHRALLKTSEEGSVEATVELLRSCLPSDILNSANQSRALVRLVDTLTKGFSPETCVFPEDLTRSLIGCTSFSKEVQEELSNLEQRLSATLIDRFEDIDGLVASEELMNLWVHALSLRRWLKLDRQSPFIDLSHDIHVQLVPGDGILLVGPKLCSWASNASGPSVVGKRTAAFAILAEELHWSPNEHRLSQLGVILATYVSFIRSSGPDGNCPIVGVFV